MKSQGLHVLIVEARFYEHISDFLQMGAVKALGEAGATYEIVSVPGALEIPAAIAIAHRAKQQDYDAYVALGCVLRGETSHYDTVCNESASGLMHLGVLHGLAIGNGILTCETEAQALERAMPDKMDKGGGAAKAALDLVNIKRRFARV